MSGIAGPIVIRSVGLGKRFGRSTVALAGVDLDIRTGTSTALVGPNGAGKSTLLKAWVGFERPTSGRVEVAGLDPWRQRAKALPQIAYVDQTPRLYRELSVRDHLRLARTLRPRFDVPYALARVADLGISPDAAAGTLSGGEQAQVCLSIALGTRAEILLLDEPVASLDPLARREFLQVVEGTARQSGTTIVLASHLIADIEGACDHVIVLGRGRKLLDMPIAEAIAGHAVSTTTAQPGQSLVAKFPGSGGSVLTLLADAPRPSQRPPTLEELVLGYLASARATPVAS
jgi:ABC-2 type transport system ATP-binding protein